MAELRVFVSSTCYDLSLLRSQLRTFIKTMGYEPIMSDYEDVLYDPRIHTHTSCVDEVRNCDILILIIGSRFGGKASPDSLNKINFEVLKTSQNDHQNFFGYKITYRDIPVEVENNTTQKQENTTIPQENKTENTTSLISKNKTKDPEDNNKSELENKSTSLLKHTTGAELAVVILILIFGFVLVGKFYKRD